MKKKAILLFLLTAILVNGYSQKNNKSKCRLVHDRELNIDVYKDVDSSAVVINEDEFNELVTSKEFSFKEITKKYPNGQRVKIAYMIGINGKATFLKVLDPVNDYEIEAEAKRMINLLPLYKPCKCNSEVIPCDAKLNVPLIKTEKKE